MALVIEWEFVLFGNKFGNKFKTKQTKYNSHWTDTGLTFQKLPLAANDNNTAGRLWAVVFGEMKYKTFMKITFGCFTYRNILFAYF